MTNMTKFSLFFFFFVATVCYTQQTSAQSNFLFPCDGVTLGKTTVQELEDLGARTLRINDRTNQPYTYYIVRGQNVWFDEDSGLAMRYNIVHTGTLPEKWISLGMSFENSYDQWLEFAQTYKLDVLVKRSPQKRVYRGHDTFSAELGLHYVADGIAYAIELNFNYSTGTETSDKNTLYSIRVKAQ